MSANVSGAQNYAGGPIIFPYRFSDKYSESEVLAYSSSYASFLTKISTCGRGTRLLPFQISQIFDLLFHWPDKLLGLLRIFPMHAHV
jgi:hypothetical protein